MLPPARGLSTGSCRAVPQRSASVFRSVVDVRETCGVARHAAGIALSDASGYMGAILRDYAAAECKIRYDEALVKEHDGGDNTE